MKYEEYKDSGMSWVGDVPINWQRKRIKFLCSNSSAGIWGEEEKGDVNDIVCFRIADFDYQRGYLCFDKLTFRNIQSKDLNGRTLTENSLLIEKSGGGEVTPVGRVVRYNYGDKATCSNFIHFITINKLYNRDFLYYYFYALYANKENLLYFNQTTGIQNLKIGEYLGQSIFLPSFTEQQAIATYLDKKCGEINHAIDVQKKKIDLLGELKQTIITDAVTKGLNPNATMKDSGMEWIGQVPQHWEVMRLRFVCEFRNGYTPSKANPDFWVKGTIPWYRMEDIREKGRFLNEANQYITKEAVKGNGLFEAGSFILATTATIGEHAVLIVDSLANQQFTNLKIRKSLIHRVVRDFFFYYLFVIDNYCKSTTRVATFPAVNMNDLKNFCVTLPSIQEQQSIVAHIEKKITKIDSQITKANRRIELLEELKHSIITEAVTGKIKVC